MVPSKPFRALSSCSGSLKVKVVTSGDKDRRFLRFCCRLRCTFVVDIYCILPRAAISAFFSSISARNEAITGFRSRLEYTTA